MPWEIPEKISLLAVAILFLFTFFNLILDAPPKRSFPLSTKKKFLTNDENLPIPPISEFLYFYVILNPIPSEENINDFFSQYIVKICIQYSEFFDNY